MKLLVLASGLETSTLDPAACWMYELTARLAARGHRVAVLCTGPLEPGETPEDPPGVSVWRGSEDGLVTALTSALALEPDLVHVALTGPMPPEMATALRGAHVLVDLLDWSPLCPAGDLLTRPRGEPCEQHYPVAPCGSCAGHSRVRSMDALAQFARAGHRVVAHASYVRDRATLALGRGVAFLPVGVDATRFTESPEPPLSPEVGAIASDRSHPRVLLLGPPTPGRGGDRMLDLLIALHARVPGVELVVAGTDPGHPDAQHVLLAEAKELGVASQLRSLPRVARGDLPALLAAVDVGVAPGLAPEPLGLAIVQALATGLPVVAHPAGAVPGLLEDGRAGLLVSANQMGLFADAVAQVLTENSARLALGETARLAAIERHEIERAVFDTETLYERVRAPRGLRGPGIAPRARRAAA
ncbi:MAG TPA: glycosyltransferase family 4 protein [Candidatus Eisenbacteria bacterium]